MKIYCINLDRRPDRLAHMTKILSHYGLPFVRVSAVDGEQPEIAAMADKCGTGIYGRKMSTGAYAIFQSHRNVWKAFLDSNESHAMVLEDDILLADDMADYLHVEWIPKEADIVKLETFGIRTHVDSGDGVQAGRRRLYRLRSRHCGTGCYIISRRAANYLLSETKTYEDPIDEVLFNEQSNIFQNLVVYQMIPALAQQGKRTQSINNDDWAKTSIKSRFAEGADSDNNKKESINEKIFRRIKHEIHALRHKTNYIVVPFRKTID